ncbi:hypothetical protein J3B02_004474 [Coemansia erecta]|uniref:Uncharacterized protein n=1 Tax=Coemansia asiatica TaxID=1052880 RepID=A0A9W7XHV0_9FUNG|nr:hypothetical protein LPJ64_004462 [Coemansia asiatica]KAJ2846195.1 hypothetical protein J3B02_004474 [Coemansia erecta]KAJ2886706.1 hypothetical protein FB639_001531 [Coemansia asiatica]
MGGTIALVPSAIVGCIILGLIFYSKKIRRRKLKMTDADAYHAHCSGNPSTSSSSSYENFDEHQSTGKRSKHMSTDSERPETFYGPSGTDANDMALLNALKQQNEQNELARKREAGENEENDGTLEGGTHSGNRDSARDLHLMQSRFPRGIRPQRNDGEENEESSQNDGVQRRPNRGRARPGVQHDSSNNTQQQQQQQPMQMANEQQFQQPGFPPFTYDPNMVNPYVYAAQMQQANMYHPAYAYMANPYQQPMYHQPVAPPHQPTAPDNNRNGLEMYNDAISSFEEFANRRSRARRSNYRQSQAAVQDNGLLIDLGMSGQTQQHLDGSSSSHNNAPTHAGAAPSNPDVPPTYEQTIARDGHH